MMSVNNVQQNNKNQCPVKLMNHYYTMNFLKSNILLEMLKILYIIIKIIHYMKMKKNCRFILIKVKNFPPKQKNSPFT